MNEAIHLSELPLHLGVNLMNRQALAWAYANLGDMHQAFAVAHQLMTDTKDSVFPNRVMPPTLLARIHLLSGDTAAADEAAQRIDRTIALDGFYTELSFEIGLLDAELAIAHRDFARAVSLVDDLQTHLRRLDFRIHLSDALYLKGLALLQQGLVDDVHSVLNEARSVAEAIGSRRALWPILALLGQIEAQRGNPAHCDSLCAQARSIVTYIADHTGTPELRASFLALPQVHAVLAG